MRARGFALFISWALAAGCVQSATTLCGNGRVCPANTQCYAPLSLCVVPEQLSTCSGAAEGAPCSFADHPTGECHAGVCVPQHCGDGLITGSENCDGVNIPAGVTCIDRGFHEAGALACNADCTFDTTNCGSRCGDGILDDGEDCDGTAFGAVTDCTDPTIGYYTPGPLGCTSFCTFDVSSCMGKCGNGVKDPQETCEGAPPPGSCLDYGLDAGFLTCSPFCFPSIDNCAGIGWRSEITAADQTLAAVFGSSASNIFAVGINGTIQRYDGTAWTRMTAAGAESLSDVWTGGATNAWAVGASVVEHYNGTSWSYDAGVSTSASLQGIWGTSSTNLWVVGTAGAMFERDVSGWHDRSIASGPDFSSVWGTSATNIWAVGRNSSGSIIYHFNGSSWSPFATSLTAFRLTDVYGRAANDVWAVGESGDYENQQPSNVVTAHFDGTAWTLVSGAPASGAPALEVGALYDVWVADSGDAYAVGAAGTGVFHWDGRAWMEEETPSITGHYAVWGSSTSDVLVVGEYSFAYRYRGRAWSVGFTGAPTSANWTYAMWASDSDDLWAAGLSGMLERRDANGWRADGSATNGSNSAIWGFAPDDIWVGDNAWYVHHYDGTTWSAATLLPGATSGVNAMWGSGPHDVWGVGFGGAIVHYDGSTWTRPTSPTSVALWSIWGFSPSDIWAVGDAGTLLHYNGTSWSKTTLPTTDSLSAIWGAAPSDIWIVGPTATLYHYDGASWTPVASPSPGLMYSIYGFGPDDIFMTGPASTLFHYQGTWNQVRIPVSFKDLTYAIPFGTPKTITFAGVEGAYFALDRTVPWSCRPKESACGDRMDDDCDGKVDIADPDCKATFALSEIHAGTVDYVELTNRGDVGATLFGLTLTYRGSCDASPTSKKFLTDAIIQPHGVMRAVDSIDDVRAHERYAGRDVCDEPGGAAWYALCSGPCDLTTCSNVLDYVERSGGAAVPGRPACEPSTTAVDVSSEPASGDTTKSLQRVGFNGTATDWTLGTATRD